MRARNLVLHLVAAAVVSLLASAAGAQTTGRLLGVIEDAQGAAVPGVTVTVTSPQLQGASTSVTDATGQYRFPALPPGTYSVKAELQSFKPFTQDNVRVTIDQTITLNIRLQLSNVTETVNVTAAAPVIDTTSSVGGVSVGQEVFEQLPMKRDIYALTRLAAGVTTDTFGPSFKGSSSAENNYIIDGLNTTGVDTGTEGKTLNTDFIQEVQVQTGGMNAEYGRLTGGAINVITKSGGNKFSGDLFGFGQGGGLQAANSTATKLSQWQTTLTNTSHLADYGGDLGGFLVKDKLWFFAAYDRVNQRDEATVIQPLAAPGSPSLGSTVPADITKNLFAAKLTWKLTQNHTISGTVTGDPNTREGAIFTTANGQNFVINGPASTWQGTLDQGGTDSIAHYDGILGRSVLLSGSVGQHREKVQYGGPGASTPQFINQTVSPTQTSGGFTAYDDQNFHRNVVKGDLTKYWGPNTIKFGADYEDIGATINRYEGGNGQRIYELQSKGVIYYRHRYYVNDLAPNFSRTDPTTWQILNPLSPSPETTNGSVYLQDSYRPVSNLTVNVGLRWERQHMVARESGATLNNNWAPRLGVVWDPTNSGKAKVYFNYGRFYENIPQDINIRAFGGEVQAFAYNFSPDPSNIVPVATAPSKSSILGSTFEPVDPNLKGQFIDEFIGGVEYEVMPNTTVGIRGAYRTLGRVIEDFLVPASGDYFIANPGEGVLGQSLGFYNGGSAPAPKAQRTDKSLELTLRKRYSNNWQFLASYVFEKLEGNYDGTFQNSTGQLDPNINSAFDYADFLVNAQGPLTNQHQHQLKFDGNYTVPSGVLNGLQIGGSFHWLSGLPLTAYGYSFAYANWEYYLTPRGSLGTGPSDYEADVHLGYPIKIGGSMRATVLMDVFNIFNRQSATVLDQRYNLVPNGPCGGVPAALCNGDGGLVTLPGTLTPVAQLANPLATAPNPDFLKAGTFFTQPRSARIGVRFSF